MWCTGLYLQPVGACTVALTRSIGASLSRVRFSGIFRCSPSEMFPRAGGRPFVFDTNASAGTAPGGSAINPAINRGHPTILSPRMHARTQIRTRARARTHTHAHTHAHTRARTHAHTHAHTQARLPIQACVRSCAAARLPAACTLAHFGPRLPAHDHLHCLPLRSGATGPPPAPCLASASGGAAAYRARAGLCAAPGSESPSIQLKHLCGG